MYGGVAIDAGLLAGTGNLVIKEPAKGEAWAGCALLSAVALVDLPFTFVADTLTLPRTCFRLSSPSGADAVHE